MPISKTCEICNAPYKVKPSKALTSHYCSYACNNASRRGQNLVDNTCQHCGRVFVTMRSHARPCCSHACASKHKTRQVAVACPNCGRVRLRPPSNANHLHCSQACSKAPLKKPRAFHCARCDKQVVKVAKVAKLSRFCSRACYQKFRGESGPEIATRQALELLGVDYIAQYPVARFSIDFYLPGLSIGLEVDGLYWHSTPKQKASDQRKEAYLAKQSIKTVRVSDKEIRSASDLPKLIAQKLHIKV